MPPAPRNWRSASRKGLQFLTAYTWSHALANSSTPLSGATNFGFPDPTNLASAYSSAAWDIRHSFTTSFNYELPFGKGKQFGGSMNRALDLVVGGWQTNGILTRCGPASRLLLPARLARVNWGRCLPDLVPGQNPNAAPAGGRSPGTNGLWFDTSAFQVAYQNPATGVYTGGNLGLESNTGPPTRTLDFSIFKDFSFTERIKLQFRAEAINMANTPQFSTPDASLGDAKLPATGTLPAVNGNGNFGKVLGANVGTERHIQFQLRLSF